MPLPIPLRSWGYLALMPKRFVVLWGRPLESSFATCLPKEQISEAVQIYRSYYKEKASMKLNSFPQIVDLLEELSSSYPLYITTTKIPQPLKTWLKIWESIISLMAFMAPALKHPHKADVIRQALQTHQLAPEQAIIIGDTKFDMMGAQETCIQKLAVTWDLESKQTC